MEEAIERRHQENRELLIPMYEAINGRVGHPEEGLVYKVSRLKDDAESFKRELQEGRAVLNLILGAMAIGVTFLGYIAFHAH